MTTNTTTTTEVENQVSIMDDLYDYYMLFTEKDSTMKWEQGKANKALSEVVRPMLLEADAKGKAKLTQLGNIVQAYGKAGLNPLQAIKSAKAGLNDADTKNPVMTDEEIACVNLCLLANKQAVVTLSSPDDSVKQTVSVAAMLFGLTSGKLPTLKKGDALTSFFTSKF